MGDDMCIEVPNFIFGKICKIILEPWEAIQGPFVNNLRKIKEIVLKKLRVFKC